MYTGSSGSAGLRARVSTPSSPRKRLGLPLHVNARWRYDTTALMMAARRGHAEVVKLLLEGGARPNVKDTFYGMTPLSSAASGGR